LRIPGSWLNNNTYQNIANFVQKSSETDNSNHTEKNSLIKDTNTSLNNKKEIILSILRNMDIDISSVNEFIVSRTELLFENNIYPDIKIVLNDWENINGIFSQLNNMKDLINSLLSSRQTDNVLRDMLLEFLGNINNLLAADIDMLQSNPLLMKEILLKTGIFFEQKLYKWYISGGDTELLPSLFKDDLKGIIFLLIDVLKKDGSLSRNKKNTLEKEIISLSDNITRYQLLNFVNDTTESGGFVFELPFGAEKKGKNLKFYREKVTGGKKDNIDLKMVSFQIETEKMGLINVSIERKDRNLYLRFVLEDKNIEDIFRENSSVLEQRLVKKGYLCRLNTFISQKKMGTTLKKNNYKKIDTLG